MTLHLTTPGTNNPACRLFVRGLAVTAATALLVAGSALTASAVPNGSTVGNVAVNSTIALTGLTPTFTLTGNSGATVEGLSAVSMTVETNNLLGYAVSVQAANPTLTPPVHTVLNADSIPIAALSVKETGARGGNYTPLSSSAAFTVHSQIVRSASGGDTIRNDYQVVIPFVNEDTYSVTLNYIATTL